MTRVATKHAGARSRWGTRSQVSQQHSERCLKNIESQLTELKPRLSHSKLVEVIAHIKSGDVQRAARRILDAMHCIWAGSKPLDDTSAQMIIDAVKDALWTTGSLMSFALTTDQLLDGSKSVTRRKGWASLRPGMRLRAVKKAMGFRKGERPEVLAVIEVVDVRRERLDAITGDDVVREGFPAMSPAEFVAMFCKHMGTRPESIVTRIEFRVLHRFVGEAGK